ncbi:hypothetical protein LXA43DRAFT_1066815 [Ganoderma leucocontextum]|nr:hypothetical protein LXA43DRAFT_1066815 [Ganoderma leucocontextum]
MPGEIPWCREFTQATATQSNARRVEVVCAKTVHNRRNASAVAMYRDSGAATATEGRRFGRPSMSMSTHQREQTALHDEGIGGFDDDYAAVPRQVIITRKNPMPNLMAAIVPKAMKSAGRRQGRHASRSQVSPTISHVFFTRDKWVRKTVLRRIDPSMENPWDLDGQSGRDFREKLNFLLAKLHPNRVPHDFNAGDKLWRFIRQHVYDWRRNFGKLAIKHAEAEVANALAKGGEATYSAPNLEPLTGPECVDAHIFTFSLGALISVARSEVPSFVRAEAFRVQEADNDADAFVVVDPPSFPVFEY